MKKPPKGKKKAIKNRIAKKRFVSNAERKQRRQKYRDRLAERERLMRQFNEEMFKLMQAGALEASENADELTENTEDALFDNQESESDD